LPIIQNLKYDIEMSTGVDLLVRGIANVVAEAESLSAKLHVFRLLEAIERNCTLLSPSRKGGRSVQRWVVGGQKHAIG
jgi:hypothetical protein